jgi:inosine-uridine nucleoside N-ribohydrolase
MAEKVLLSTDIGSDIDDALALLTMFNSEINLDGIYTVNGDVFARGYISKHLVDLAGKQIEVGIGEAKPLEGGIRPYTYFEECYIDDKFIYEEETDLNRDIVFQSPQKVGIRPNGLERMAGKLADSPMEVFSIAPLTNIARLLEKYPESAKNIKQLYVMGCRFAEDDMHEHNVRFDIPSAMAVFDSDIPITVIPGDLCSRYRMPVEQIDQMKSKAGGYVRRMARGFLAAKTAQEFERNEIEDLLKRNANIDPEYIRNEPNKMEVARNYERLGKLVVNMNDSFFGAFDPEDYFKQYQELISHLRDPKLNYSRGNTFAGILEMAILKDISVADVYVPYCFLHPERTKTERANVTINPQGYSRKQRGERHSIVTDLDFGDFREFVDKYLR